MNNVNSGQPYKGIYFTTKYDLKKKVHSVGINIIHNALKEFVTSWAIIALFFNQFNNSDYYIILAKQVFVFQVAYIVRETERCVCLDWLMKIIVSYVLLLTYVKCHVRNIRENDTS